MTLLSFDEMNVLASKSNRSMDIDKYFDEMDLPVQDKKDRKEFARRLETELFEFMAYLHFLLERDLYESLPSAKNNLADTILGLVLIYTYPDSRLQEYIQRYASDFVDTTERNASATNQSDEQASYWFSEDRARFNAENEANTIFNIDQFTAAVAAGYTEKTWITMRDERVRRTHAEQHNMTIPIGDYFPNGLLYPKDPDGDPEEIINCRCTLKFT